MKLVAVKLLGLLLVLGSASVGADAQTLSSSRQLDRIEEKLDRVIHMLRDRDDHGGSSYRRSSSVDTQCLADLRKGYGYSLDSKTLFEWLKICRDSEVEENANCDLVSSERNQACFEMADKLYTYAFTSAEIQRVAEECKTRTYICERPRR